MSPEEARLLKVGDVVKCYKVLAKVTKRYNPRYPKVISVQLLSGASKTSWFISEVEKA